MDQFERGLQDLVAHLPQLCLLKSNAMFDIMRNEIRFCVINKLTDLVYKGNDLHEYRRFVEECSKEVPDFKDVYADLFKQLSVIKNPYNNKKRQRSPSIDWEVVKEAKKPKPSSVDSSTDSCESDDEIRYFGVGSEERQPGGNSKESYGEEGNSKNAKEILNLEMTLNGEKSDDNYEHTTEHEAKSENRKEHEYIFRRRFKNDFESGSIYNYEYRNMKASNQCEYKIVYEREISNNFEYDYTYQCSNGSFMARKFDENYPRDFNTESESDCRENHNFTEFEQKKSHDMGNDDEFNEGANGDHGDENRNHENDADGHPENNNCKAKEHIEDEAAIATVADEAAIVEDAPATVSGEAAIVAEKIEDHDQRVTNKTNQDTEIYDNGCFLENLYDALVAAAEENEEHGITAGKSPSSTSSSMDSTVNDVSDSSESGDDEYLSSDEQESSEDADDEGQEDDDDDDED